MILNTSNIVGYLVNKNLLKADEAVSIIPLHGGNVNKIFLVKAASNSFVLKQALEKPQFNKNISLSRGRIIAEKEAMVLWKKRTNSNSIPKIYFFDKENFILVMEAVSENYSLLTYALLEGKVNLSLAKKLGAFYASLHNSTYRDLKIKKQFDSQEVFKLFKMKLFHEEFCNSASEPKIKENIKKIIQKTCQNRVTLIHGDAQPKNILVNKDNFYVLDYEITTFGDPAHDIGNTAAHYLLTAIINYPLRRRYYKAIELMFKEYEEKVVFKDILSQVKSNALLHFAPVIYGRVDGTANVPFIDEKTKVVLRRIIHLLALKENLTLSEIFALVDKEAISLLKNKPLKREQVKNGRLY